MTHLQRKLCTLLNAAAILICPLVGAGLEKAVQQVSWWHTQQPSRFLQMDVEKFVLYLLVHKKSKEDSYGRGLPVIRMQK